MGLRDDILSSGSRRVLEPVEVPELGATIHVPRLTVAEACRLAEVTKGDDSVPRLFIFIARTAAGEAIFSDADLPLVRGLDMQGVGRVIEAYTALNGGDAKKKS